MLCQVFTYANHSALEAEKCCTSWTTLQIILGFRLEWASGNFKKILTTRIKMFLNGGTNGTRTRNLPRDRRVL